MLPKIFILPAIFLLLAKPAMVMSQRNPGVFTPSPHALEARVIEPAFKKFSKQKLPVYRVEIIDNRYDVSRIGFQPEYKKAPRELKLSSSLPDILKKIITEGIETDDKQNRKLLVLIQQCWITYEATSKYSLLKKNLHADLIYNFECFTVIDTNYYPVKRISGNIAVPFDEETSGQVLVDSLVHTLQTELPGINIESRESSKTILSEIKVDDYVTKKTAKIPKRILYGVYPTYEDFLNQKSITDSIDIIPYKDYSERNVVAAHLGIIKNGLVEPCSKYWGFFDGRFLFLNTGNGFFIRMFPVNNQFVFADLQQIAMNTKKKSITSEAMIGHSPYDIIKDFGKTYHLFFMLNYEDGKLY